jgi:hypothetical protein
MASARVRWMGRPAAAPIALSCYSMADASVKSGRRWLSARDHATMMQGIGIDEIAVGGEARVVPVLDMRPVDFVAAVIGSLTLTAGLDSIQPVCQAHQEGLL